MTARRASGGPLPGHVSTYARLKEAVNYAVYLLDEALARPGPQALVRVLSLYTNRAARPFLTPSDCPP